jgi:glutaminyl-peptide cyclotransferase
MRRAAAGTGMLLALSLAACGGGGPSAGTTRSSDAAAAQAPLPTWRYEVVNVYPHDPQAFTQGLIFRDGFLYESTGQRGRSTLRKVRLETGEVVQQRAIDPQYFGEGLAASRGRLIQLTWQAGRGFVYDPGSFEITRTFDYLGEGWGLTADDQQLIMSDGSTVLRFLDAGTFEERRRTVVRDDRGPVVDLNELELVRGEVWANVWHRDQIARIDPVTGAVRGWIDLAGLLAPGEVSDPEAVLNGIAYDAAGDRLFVTGKYWPKLFEIRVQ